MHQTSPTARKQLGVLGTGRQCHREEATRLLMTSTLPFTEQPLPLSQPCRNCLCCVLPVLTHLTTPKFSPSSLNLSHPTEVIEVTLAPSSLTLQCLTITTSIHPCWGGSFMYMKPCVYLKGQIAPPNSDLSDLTSKMRKKDVCMYWSAGDKHGGYRSRGDEATVETATRFKPGHHAVKKQSGRPEEKRCRNFHMVPY